MGVGQLPSERRVEGWKPQGLTRECYLDVTDGLWLRSQRPR
jgi:hypothetical protein